MSREWKEYKFSEIMDIIGGGTPKTNIEEYWNGNIPWLSVKDFNSVNRTVYDTEKKITELGLEKSSTKMLSKGDLIISARGTVGALAQLGRPMAFNQSCYGLRANNKTTNDFLFYLLKYKLKSIKQNTHGSVFDTITRNTFDVLTANIPSNINEQKIIAHILSSLDEKIEVNNRINKKLEGMAQTIFKHWFVDFEFPNENGEPYKSSGGEMIESELGMIPMGWEVKELKEITVMKNGVNYSREQEGNEVKVVNVRDFDGSLIVNESKLDSIFLPGKQINDYLLEKYDTIVVRSAKPGETLLIADKSEIVYSGFTIRVRGKKELLKLYIFYCIRNAIKMLNNSSNGTVFKNLNQQILGTLKIVVPESNIIESFNSLTITLLDFINERTIEVEKLSNLRDTLLPKLMSGEISVPLDNEE